MRYWFELGVDWIRRSRHKRRETVPKPTPAQVRLFVALLTRLLSSGLSLTTSLQQMRLDRGSLGALAAAMNRRLFAGQTFSVAIALTLQLERSLRYLLEAGERSGRMLEVLAQVTERLEKERQLRQHSFKVMLYPSLLLISFSAAFAFLMVFLVPKLKLLLANLNQALPWYSQALFALSDAFTQLLSVLLVLVLVIAAVAAGLWRQPNMRLRWDRWRLYWPLLGYGYRRLELARIAGLLSMLLISKVPWIDALRAIGYASNNRYLQQRFEQVGALVLSGQRFSQALQSTQLFGRGAQQLIALAEISGDLPQVLEKIAGYYEEDAKLSSERFLALVEPVTLLLFGLLMVWMVVAIFYPLYDAFSGGVGR